jgi:hypothetical protein
MLVSRRYLKAMELGKASVPIEKHMKEGGIYAKCLCYCFSVDNIDLEGKKIKGYVFRSDLNSWEYRWLPMADVIYDRAPYLGMDEKPVAFQLRKQLRALPNVNFINSYGSLGKWPLYKALSKHDEMKGFLPETKLYKNFNNILVMLNKYHFIFLKSSLDSKG